MHEEKRSENSLLASVLWVYYANFWSSKPNEQEQIRLSLQTQ